MCCKKNLDGRAKSFSIRLEYQCPPLIPTEKTYVNHAAITRCWNGYDKLQHMVAAALICLPQCVKRSINFRAFN